MEKIIKRDDGVWTTAQTNHAGKPYYVEAKHHEQPKAFGIQNGKISKLILHPYKKRALLRESVKGGSMSTKKNWTGQEKLAIVLQGLRGNCRISELCNEHGITQGMFYRWRDQLLNDGAKLFAHGGVDHEVERLQRENRKLKETIGELTMELKKNDWD